MENKIISKWKYIGNKNNNVSEKRELITNAEININKVETR